jgi:lipopolysaccharide biosynthesis protein
MRIYRILTNKRDFERVIGEKVEHCQDDFFLITESLEAFRAIAVDKLYKTELLKSLFNVFNIEKNKVRVDMNKFLEVNNNALSEMKIEDLEPLIIEKLFSERVYQEHLTDDDPVEQAINELAVMVSRNIEFDYNHEMETEIEGFCFAIYEPEYRSKAINDALETGLSFYEYQSSFL